MKSAEMTIITGSRLHFGPMAWRPRRGRDFGGWGVMLQTPRTVIRIGETGSLSNSQHEMLDTQSRADRILAELLASQCPGFSKGLRVVVDEEPPPHGGFGSGTQLSLAIAAGVTWLSEGHRVPAVELAGRVGRGVRSAVGIHGFDLGGLIVDAGKRPGDSIGQLAAHVELPPDWRFVLIRPHAGQGISGDMELAAFNSLPAFSDTLSERLSRIVLTEILPAAKSREGDAFACALDEYGTLVGEAFTPCQGGVVHPASISIWQSLRNLKLNGIAQTSWGPTLAVFCESPDIADRVAAVVREAAPSAEMRITGIRNEGAAMMTLDEAGPRRLQSPPARLQ